MLLISNALFSLKYIEEFNKIKNNTSSDNSMDYLRLGIRMGEEEHKNQPIIVAKNDCGYIFARTDFMQPVTLNGDTVFRLLDFSDYEKRDSKDTIEKINACEKLCMEMIANDAIHTGAEFEDKFQLYDDLNILLVFKKVIESREIDLYKNSLKITKQTIDLNQFNPAIIRRDLETYKRIYIWVKSIIDLPDEYCYSVTDYDTSNNSEWSTIFYRLVSSIKPYSKDGLLARLKDVIINKPTMGLYITIETNPIILEIMYKKQHVEIPIDVEIQHNRKFSIAVSNLYMIPPGLYYITGYQSDSPLHTLEITKSIEQRLELSDIDLIKAYNTYEFRKMYLVLVLLKAQDA